LLLVASSLSLLNTPHKLNFAKFQVCESSIFFRCCCSDTTTCPLLQNLYIPSKVGKPIQLYLNTAFPPFTFPKKENSYEIYNNDASELQKGGEQVSLIYYGILGHILPNNELSGRSPCPIIFMVIA
jgi:hypothetical protein